MVGIAKRSNHEDALPRAVAVHRIDVPTKGLVMLAKTKSALIQMGKAFQENRVKKEYQALVHGTPPANGVINTTIDGKHAETHFETIQTVSSLKFSKLSLVKLMPQTGRTHQLRIHLAQENHLIIGDKEYAENTPTILGKGLYLCACRLQFKHPRSQKNLDIQINPPTKFGKLMEKEAQRFQQFSK